MGVISYGAILQNEVKAWPPLKEIGSGVDLVTLNQWWDDEGTPTTKATAVPSSGESGLDAKFTEVIKCVTDANDEGFIQRYTYADEPRIKSGAHLSALIWVATTAGGSGITAKLRNSGGSSTSATAVATDGDWTLLCVEDHTCSGTYVELVVTKDASGTFYAGGSITVMIGEDVVMLPPRKGTYRLNAGAQTAVEDLSSTGSKAIADLDLTSASSPLAFMAELHMDILEGATGSFNYTVRPNGETSWSAGAFTGPAMKGVVMPSDKEQHSIDFLMLLDDLQIIETELANSGGGTVDYARLYLVGWWEWE